MDEGGEYWGNLYARGARAFTSSSGHLTVVDTSDKRAPSLKRRDTQGWGCSSLEVAGARARTARSANTACSASPCSAHAELRVA